MSWTGSTQATDCDAIRKWQSGHSVMEGVQFIKDVCRKETPTELPKEYTFELEYEMHAHRYNSTIAFVGGGSV